MSQILFFGRIDKLVTFKDFKEKHHENKEARKAYSQNIRAALKKLISIYTVSLDFPAEAWRDIEGVKHPYVYITDDSIYGRKGSVEPSDVCIDPSTGACINLHTVTDDDPRTPQVEALSVSIKVVNDDIQIAVRGYEIKSFSPVDSDEKYAEVCEFIKDSILMAISQNTVGEKISKESVKLWD